MLFDLKVMMYFESKVTNDVVVMRWLGTRGSADPIPDRCVPLKLRQQKYLPCRGAGAH